MDKDLLYFMIAAGFMLGMVYLIFNLTTKPERAVIFKRDKEGNITEIIEKRI